MDSSAQIALLGRILAAAKARLDARGARLVFVFLPSWERFYTPALLGDDRPRTAELAAAREAGLPVIGTRSRSFHLEG